MTDEGRHGVEILRCPISQTELHWLSVPEVERLNENIRAGSLHHLDGTVVERPLTAALASDGGEFIHRFEDGVFFLLSTAAISGAPPGAAVASWDLGPETTNVRRFYDEFGWRTADEGRFQDALKFEDLRPVSRDYIRRCHRRITRYLPPRGKYLLDAASGPIQYREYLTYSRRYEFRICADVSELALRHARRRLGKRGIYLLCDVTRLPLKDNIVDGFVSLHTIYHIAAPQQPKAIEELYRVLKPRGSGVVVYSWGARSPLMNAFDAPPLRALERVAGAVRSWAVSSRRGRANTCEVRDMRDQPPLFGHSHDFMWYRELVERPYRSSLVSWRSVSVPFLQRFVHERAFGRPLLALLYSLESWFPRWFGRYGQYPAFVLVKRDGRQAVG